MAQGDSGESETRYWPGFDSVEAHIVTLIQQQEQSLQSYESDHAGNGTAKVGLVAIGQRVNDLVRILQYRRSGEHAVIETVLDAWQAEAEWPWRHCSCGLLAPNPPQFPHATADSLSLGAFLFLAGHLDWSGGTPEKLPAGGVRPASPMSLESEKSIRAEELRRVRDPHASPPPFTPEAESIEEANIINANAIMMGGYLKKMRYVQAAKAAEREAV